MQRKIWAIVLLLVFTVAISCSFLAANMGYYIACTNGHSMEPTMKAFNVIWGHKVDSPSDIQNGSLVAFCFSNEKFVHRVTEISQDSEGYLFWIYGDNRKFCGFNGQVIRFSAILFVVDGFVGV